MSAADVATWLAVGIGGVIGYVACAGVAWRLCRPAPDVCGPAQECQHLCGYDGPYTIHCPNHQSRHKANVAAAFWPVVGAGWLTFHLAVAIYLPLRATFRLASGQISALEGTHGRSAP